MPAGDRTGPAGMGPRSGWGLGDCSGYDAPGWSHPEFGQRFARGRGQGGRGMRGGRRGGYGRGGGGWGWRNQFYATGSPGWERWGPPPAEAYGAPFAPPSREQEVEMLKGEAEWLKEQLGAITQRMEELDQE
jgi:hypothetical protein